MSIAIDKSKCTGCGRCCNICPGTLIRKDIDGKAYIRYPKDCWGCTSCIKECPVYAISFFLGADMGGKGSKVHTEKRDGLIHWIIEPDQGEITDITVNPKESNKY